MTNPNSLVHSLRNKSAHDLIKALERDNFCLRRTTRTGGRIYVHSDQRRVVIHYHHSSDRFTRKVLSSILDGTRWTETDIKRLKL